MFEDQAQVLLHLGLKIMLEHRLISEGYVPGQSHRVAASKSQKYRLQLG